MTANNHVAGMGGVLDGAANDATADAPEYRARGSRGARLERTPRPPSHEATPELDDRWRLIVLLLVSVVRDGASIGGLIAGMKIIPSSAIIACVRRLAADGYIIAKGDLENPRYYLGDGISVDFKL
jgi:hypothetical protein